LGFTETGRDGVTVGLFTGILGVLVTVAGARITRIGVDVVVGRITTVVFVGRAPADKSQLYNEKPVEVGVIVGDEVAGATPGVTDAEVPFVVDPSTTLGKDVDVLKLNTGISGSCAGSGAKKYRTYIAIPVHRKKPSTANAVIHHILLPFRRGWVKLRNMFLF
jgi:hypothetical protein